MHQQPPKMPLLRSTSAANAVHVDGSRAFTEYPGSLTKPSLTRAQRMACPQAGSFTEGTGYALRGRIEMFSPPPILPGRPDRSREEDGDWEKRRDKLGKRYDGSPVLTALVNFSGFLAIFAGSLAALFTVANLRHGTQWVPYALVLAALAGAHLCLRAARRFRHDR